jgi:multidrug efflux system membrane fusion protein
MTDALEPDRDIPPRHARRNAWLALGAVVLALVAAWAFGSHGAAGKASTGRPKATVGVAKAQLMDVPVTLNAIGTVQPVTTALVRAQEAGVLFGVHFTEGQMVRKGQLLANIDPRPFQLTLAQSQANLARDTAQLGAARIDLDRYRTLLAQDSIAHQQVDSQGALVKQLEGTVAADRAAIGSARLNLDYSAIVAPVSGRIGLRQADLGNYVTPGDATGLATITVTQPIDVSFSLPQDQIAAVRGQPAIPVTVRDQAKTNVIAQGRFLTLDNAVDASTGTVKAKARFDNPDNALFPNQFVNVSLVASLLRQVVTVPVGAVRHGPQGDFVFVLQPNRTVRLQTVRTGPQTDTMIALLSGLKPGLTVVTEGGDGLDDGSPVTLAGDKHRSGTSGRHRRS